MYTKNKTKRNVFSSKEESEWGFRKNIGIDKNAVIETIVDKDRFVREEKKIREDRNVVLNVLYDDRPVEEADKVVIVSSWGIKCGIAMHTEELFGELEKFEDGKYKGKFIINELIEGRLYRNIKGKLTHLQHEFGLMPYPPPGAYRDGPCLVSFHTITPNMIQTLKKFESELNICGYIVPCPDALKFLEGTSKDTYAIPLGSKIYGGNIENIENVEIGEDKVGEVTSKEDARERLGLQEPKWIRIGGLWFNCNKIGFVFGFQSSNKGYNRLIEAANNTGIHLVISGSTHFTGYCNYLENLGDNITFLNRHLDEEEIDLWSLASDILLFDYAPQSHYSSSAALHRTAGAGRPIICVDTNHFSEIEDEKECLKYTCLEELERHIRRVLESESEYQMLSRGAIEFAKRTSRRLTAMKHIELYRQYGGL